VAARGEGQWNLINVLNIFDPRIDCFWA